MCVDFKSIELEDREMEPPSVSTFGLLSRGSAMLSHGSAMRDRAVVVPLQMA